MRLTQNMFIGVMEKQTPKGTFSFDALAIIFKYIEQRNPDYKLNPFAIVDSFREVKVKTEKQRQALEHHVWLNHGDTYVLVDDESDIFKTLAERKEQWLSSGK